MRSQTHAGPAPSTPDGGAAPVPVTLGDIRSALEADIIWCPDLTTPVSGVVAADLMSDVLVDARPGFVLVTGLANVQVVRTAAIADLAAVVFARGKVIAPAVLELARESHLPLFRCQRSLFETAGRLYAAVSGRTEHPDGRTPA